MVLTARCVSLTVNHSFATHPHSNAQHPSEAHAASSRLLARATGRTDVDTPRSATASSSPRPKRSFAPALSAVLSSARLLSRRSGQRRPRATCATGAAPDSQPSASSASTVSVLRDSGPFLTDAELVSEEVVYEGPLCSVSGRDAYVALQAAWGAVLPERLRDFRVRSLRVNSIERGTVTVRWSAEFTAKLPPLARARGLGPEAEVLAGDLLRCSLPLCSTLTLDASGRVVRHSERVEGGFDVEATVARYEVLSARRLLDPAPLWYWRVLQHTTLEEMAAYTGLGQGGGADEDERDRLQIRFYSMVGRNFAYGLALGTALYILAAAIRSFTVAQ